MIWFVRNLKSVFGWFKVIMWWLKEVTVWKEATLALWQAEVLIERPHSLGCCWCLKSQKIFGCTVLFCLHGSNIFLSGYQWHVIQIGFLRGFLIKSNVDGFFFCCRVLTPSLTDCSSERLPLFDLKLCA